MLRNFVNIIGIADPASFPVITTANPNTQYTVQETLVIPAPKPNIEQLNTVMIEASITNYRTITTPVGLKVIIDGLINQKIIYTAADAAQSVHSAHYQEPFCTFIEIPLTLPAGMNVTQYLQSLGLTLDTVIQGKTDVLIEDVTASVTSLRTVEKCPVLFIWTTLNPALVTP